MNFSALRKSGQKKGAEGARRKKEAKVYMNAISPD
jgi:hypothetical protein